MLPISQWSFGRLRPTFRTFVTTKPQANQREARYSLRKPSSQPRRVPSRRILPPAPPQKDTSPPSEPTSNDAESSGRLTQVETVSNTLAAIPESENELITPVHIPEDPNAVLKETHPAMRLLENSAILIQRQLEMMNVLMGFEQANRYIIMDPHGNQIGYLVEQEHGLGNAVARQMFRTHRSFTTHVFDRDQNEILRFHRPFSWISSRMRVYDAAREWQDTPGLASMANGIGATRLVNQAGPRISGTPISDMRIIGAAEQEWAPLRRRYNLFLARDLSGSSSTPNTPQTTSGKSPASASKALMISKDDRQEAGMLQFARVDEPFLSWDFSLASEDGLRIGSVNRNFSGFARELFTDTGVYVLRMDAAGPAQEAPQIGPKVGMTLDQRAVMLGTAVSIDFDYFSRHSGAGGGLWPMWIPWWGGGAAAEGAAGGVAAGEAGAGATGVASEAGAAARGLGAGEGAIAGAGTMAGYEAMQRSRGTSDGSGQDADLQSPQTAESFPSQAPIEQQQPGQQGEEIWGSQEDPWGSNNDDGIGGGRGGGDGGGGGFDIGDFF